MKHCLALLAIICLPVYTLAKPAVLEIDDTVAGPMIHPDVYGQFTEHLGDGIYGGIYVGKNSEIPNTDGFRNDVLGALKKLNIPLVRWPGGCFADQYHWRDGIGPQNKRPVKVNVSWGGTREDNSFGTHEFFQLAEMLGAKAYVNGNLGSGTVQEMQEWFEYITSDDITPVTELRRQNGRDKPWDLAYFAVGNEAWGCGGNMRPEYYADLYRQYTTFLKPPAQNPPKLVASGGSDKDTSWTQVLSQIDNNIDGISLHYYTRPFDEVWEVKGSATDFPEKEWLSTLVNTQKIEGYIQANLEILEKNDPEGKLGFWVDEWGTWYDEEQATKDRILFQSNTLRDAMVAAINLNIFHKYAERVTMTMIAQMVNVLQAMILTDGEKMVLTPTYHVYDMYKVFQGATSLPVSLKKVPTYKIKNLKTKALSVSAGKGADGKIYLAVANLDPNNSHSLNVKLKSGTATRVEGTILSAETTDAENTFTNGDTVTPKSFSKDFNEQGGIEIPGKSIVVVRLQ